MEDMLGASLVVFALNVLYHYKIPEQGKGTDDHLLPLGDWFSLAICLQKSIRAYERRSRARPLSALLPLINGRAQYTSLIRRLLFYSLIYGKYGGGNVKGVLT